MDATERQQHQAEIISDFMSGTGVLEILAGRAPAVIPLLSREETLAYFAAFEASWDPLAELQAAGRLETGGMILSPETREKITRLGALLRLDPGSPDGKASEEQIRELANQCLLALAPKVERQSTGGATS